jgi:S-methylmethionine-dependent homocysteine/selenocysteine methylase
MNRYNRLMKKSQDKDVILMDGATGTEIERRGVAQLANAWNGGGAMSDPEIVIVVHEEYISKGAEVIISNTFANGRHAMQTQPVLPSTSG